MRSLHWEIAAVKGKVICLDRFFECRDVVINLQVSNI